MQNMGPQGLMRRSAGARACNHKGGWYKADYSNRADSGKDGQK